MYVLELTHTRHGSGFELIDDRRLMYQRMRIVRRRKARAQFSRTEDDRVLLPRTLTSPHAYTLSPAHTVSTTERNKGR
jgi:hypothetical protein